MASKEKTTLEYLADVAIVVAGSVDSGKSSTIGVLVTGKLDDGNGSAREIVAKHPHEISSGKTSDISTKTFKTHENKMVTLIDLCGHEKYLKTTTYGITGYYPDYAIVVISANRGVLKMTKEHLCILLYMNIPIIIVVTRADIAPTEIYMQTMQTIKLIGKKFHRQIEQINSMDDMSLSDEDLKTAEMNSITKIETLTNIIHKNDDVIPVIVTSNKTGYYIEPFKYLIGSLKPRQLWPSSITSGSVFYIDSSFNPPGIGLVVSGVLRGNNVKNGDILYLGPKGKDFYPVRVRSIHDNNKQISSELSNHQRGCFAISSIDKKIEITRKMISKGIVLISDKEMMNNICYRFTADIEVLNHSTTISKNYSPVIHCGTIRQTARLISINNIDRSNRKEKDASVEENTLRTGDIANVTFKFKFYPEFLEPKTSKESVSELKTTLFFREGTTRGTGSIDNIIPLSEDTDPNPDPVQKRKRFFRRKKNNINIKVV